MTRPLFSCVHDTFYILFVGYVYEVCSMVVHGTPIRTYLVLFAVIFFPYELFIGMSYITNSCLFHEFEVKILCHLHHDQLRAVFHVSQRIRRAVSSSLSLWHVCIAVVILSWQLMVLFIMMLQVVLARQFHFNFTTPDRSRQEMLRTMTPRPTEHWPFVRLLP